MDRLFVDYIKRAEIRIKVLYFLLQNNAYADVVREAQEIVELLLKGLLRLKGIEVPRVHDVGKIIETHLGVMPDLINQHLKSIKAISKRLRKERELSFYGADDFIPSEEYSAQDAHDAIRDAEFIFNIMKALTSEK